MSTVIIVVWRLIMTTSEQIRVLCVRSGVSLSELARRINQTPQNFSVKLKRNTVTQDELCGVFIQAKMFASNYPLKNCGTNCKQFLNLTWIRIQKEQSNICKDPITLQTRHCFGLLLTTSNHLSY